MSFLPDQDGKSPLSLYTIAPWRPFAETFVEGILARYRSDPFELARLQIFLPTRRACRLVQDVFLQKTAGQAFLVPALRPLGEISGEEVLEEGLGSEASMTPTTVEGEGLQSKTLRSFPPQRRRLLLMRLIQQASFGGFSVSQESKTSLKPSVQQSFLLAQELERLMDQGETEGCDFADLEKLVAQEGYAVHWQEVLSFLKIVTDYWPAIEQEEHAVSPAFLRNKSLEKLRDDILEDPSSGPWIAAGTTGSLPATAALLKAIAHHPKGAVVLPGLDQSSTAEVWQEISKDASHPQYGLAKLLASLDADPSVVQSWDAACFSVEENASKLHTLDLEEEQRYKDRFAFISTALLPATVSQNWQKVTEQEVKSWAPALKGIKKLNCANLHEEAQTIALLMREGLEQGSDFTVALVTPNRILARRVGAILRRFGIEVNDTAGQKASTLPLGIFFSALLSYVHSPKAEHLFSLLKHRFCALGLSWEEKLRSIEALEKALRGQIFVEPSLEVYEAYLEEEYARSGTASSEGDRSLKKEDCVHALSLVKKLKEMLAPLQALKQEKVPLSVLLSTHIQVAESLAQTPEKEGEFILWEKEEGEELAQLFSDLSRASYDQPTFDFYAYPAFFQSLLCDVTVRPVYGQHPRLSILGTMEARLLGVDRIILGALNENDWPKETEAGPWMSRPMRHDFGLPPLERKIGLSAHDFVQAFCSSEVYMTRSERAEGTPKVPSRWLTRMEALLKAFKQEALIEQPVQWTSWARRWDAPTEVRPALCPAPCPPYEARPRRVSVTGIEMWRRDPYAFYAQKILKLRKLEELDVFPDVAERGQLVHLILERFYQDYPKRFPDPFMQLRMLGEEVFKKWESFPYVKAFWQRSFERSLNDFLDLEEPRWEEIVKMSLEKRGSLTLYSQGRAFFELTAKADRLDFYRQGGMAIVDYKTGKPPSKTDVESGLSPQLVLEALIAQEGGFSGVPAADVKDLLYYRFTGAGTWEQKSAVTGEKELELIFAEEKERLEELVHFYDDPKMPYYPTGEDSKQGLKYNDYRHLSRLKEWNDALD